MADVAATAAGDACAFEVGDGVATLPVRREHTRETLVRTGSGADQPASVSVAHSAMQTSRARRKVGDIFGSKKCVFLRVVASSDRMSFPTTNG
jgi:hypothetical protein